jgi:hypothetical protein
MSRTTMLAGLLAAAAALAPRATYAQRVDGARAMLARSDAVFPVAAAASGTLAVPIDGERALLGRSLVSRTEERGVSTQTSSEQTASLDGVYALLCRRP